MKVYMKDIIEIPFICDEAMETEVSISHSILDCFKELFGSRLPWKSETTEWKFQD